MTPLKLAMELADMAIENACRMGLLKRRFRVIIVTDGMPNCGVDETTLPLLPAEWRRLGVETRVMGLPGSQGALDLMDQIADAGGSGKCVSLGSPQQMEDEMTAAVL
jgi:Mg-chelatase subunit ChlD